MKKSAFLLIAVMLCCSIGCRIERLSKKELEWQPYQEGDILIFKSNRLETDSIFITTIESHKGATGGRYFQNISDIGEGGETLFVMGEVSLRKPRKQAGKPYNRGDIHLLSLSTNGEETIFRLDLRKSHDSYRHPSITIYLGELKQMFEKQSKFNYNSIEINAEVYYNPSFDYDLYNFWWSKKYGYVRYEYKDGSYWELQKFIRNNKNILK